MKPYYRDYGMGHMCIWNQHAMGYDGICTHCALNEGITGDWDLTDEELEQLVAERQKKEHDTHNQRNRDWHVVQMATNYAEYMDNSCARVARSRANNPGRDKKRQEDRIEKAKAENTWYCSVCDHTAGTKQRYDNHMVSPAHDRQLKISSAEFICKLCNQGFHNNSNLLRNQRSPVHTDKVKEKEAEKGIVQTKLSFDKTKTKLSFKKR
jgi:hypothetical protein